jgi:hypothetical protein
MHQLCKMESVYAAQVNRTLMAALVCLVAGCAEETATVPDLAAPAADLRARDGVTLTVGGVARPLDAWYSILISPLEPGEPPVQLVVTLIEPAFRCDGASVASGLDALSFSFLARVPGVSSTFLVARAGPDLGPIAQWTGYAELDQVDDRYEGWDGGAVFVGAGGLVGGDTHFEGGNVVVDGTFRAPHCPLLDAIAAP